MDQQNNQNQNQNQNNSQNGNPIQSGANNNMIMAILIRSQCVHWLEDLEKASLDLITHQIWMLSNHS